MNYNTILNPLATMQGVVIGSEPWKQAGLNVNSHQTGGHGAYGFNHKRRVRAGGQPFVSAVGSNYLSRPVFDISNPLRHNGYEKGGRPWDYTPSEPGDLPNGRRRYVTQLGTFDVTGIDLQHADFGPLWAVISEGSEYTLETGLGPRPADEVARIIARLCTKSVIGQMRTLDPKYATGRSLFRIMHTVARAFAHRALPREDIKDFLSFMDLVGLPALERAPGLGEIISKGNHPKLGKPYANIYQSVSWMLAAVHELAEIFKDAREEHGFYDARQFGARLEAIRVRLSQYMVDIESIKGGAMRWAAIAITDKMRAGDADGNALPTLVDAVDATEIGGNPWYSDWAVCAAHIAADTLNSPEAEAMRDAVIARTRNADEVWRVDANFDFIDAA